MVSSRTIHTDKLQEGSHYTGLDFIYIQSIEYFTKLGFASSNIIILIFNTSNVSGFVLLTLNSFLAQTSSVFTVIFYTKWLVIVAVFLTVCILCIRDVWHSWSPQEQSEYQECDKNSTFGKLGSVYNLLSSFQNQLKSN